MDTDVDLKLKTCPDYVVGVGASAGGLEALQILFKGLPQNTNMAFIVIQHLSPDYPSLMVELLAKCTTMNVLRAEHEMTIRANQVYLIPPKNNLTIENSTLYLKETFPDTGLNLPIDIFLHSLATDFMEKSIAIILSGTGSDGTKGIREIKSKLGAVIVQDEISAKFSGMPNSAIATGLADYVLPIHDIPVKVKQIAFPDQKFELSHDNKDTGLSQEEETSALNKSGIERILRLIRSETRIDFSPYKETTLYRRIQKQMSEHNVHSVDEYLLFLEHEKHQLHNLAKDLLVRVTRFLRDSDAFESIRRLVIPELLTEATRTGILRIWVCGCATGEEAYSLAMLIEEEIAKMSLRLDVKIFATDADRESIDFAGNGVYSPTSLEDMPKEYLEKYFTRLGDNYQINRFIRDRVIFAVQNVLKDPPFTRIDLVTCRNLLIYIKPEHQKKILSYFNFALRNKGILFLGSSETIGELNLSFDTIDLKSKLFRKNNANRLYMGGILADSQPPETSIYSSKGSLKNTSGPAKVASPRWWQSVLKTFVHDRTVTCFIINYANEILHSFGEPEKFLKVQPGKASLNLLNLLPKEISMMLSFAINKSRKSAKAVESSSVKLPLPMSGEESNVHYHIRVVPFNDEETSDQLLVIIEPSEKKNITRDAEPLELSTQSEQRINELEQELETTRESLQAAIEETEASNEELQATNEELIAANEELQSTNEELESVNEELHTLNSEYQEKIQDLMDLNDDINNLLQTTDLGLLLLDTSLRIRRFTIALTREINILPHDVGRPLSDLSHPVIAKILPEAELVLTTKKPSEKTIKLNRRSWYLVRATPFETQERENQGLVITVINVTHVKNQEDQIRKDLQTLKKAEQTKEVILNSLPSHIAILDKKGIITDVNDSWRRFGEENGLRDKDSCIGTSYLETAEFSDEDNAKEKSALAEKMKAVLMGDLKHFSIEYPCHSRYEQRWFRMDVTQLLVNKRVVGAVIMHTNITQEFDARKVLASQ